MKPEPENSPKIDKRIMQSVRSQQRMGRAFVGLALALGILSITASVAIAWANATLVRPMERLLLEDYPPTVQQSGKNAEGKVPLPREELVWRELQVTAAHGKALFLISLAIAMQAAGTLVICGLVIFNRRATMRQINASLTQISNQLGEGQPRPGSGTP